MLAPPHCMTLPISSKNDAAATVYPGLAMFSIGAHLFKPDDYAFFHLNMRNGSLFDMMIGAEHVLVQASLLHDKVFLSISARLSAETNLCIGMLLEDMPTCNLYLRVLQRAVRRFHSARMADRRLAVAMALHPRLGACSLLNELGVDMLCKCTHL